MSNNNGKGEWGLTLGPFINGQDMTANIYTDAMFAHEFGHTIQSRRWGIIYPFIGLRSLISAGFSSTVPHPSGSGYTTSHRLKWYERQANRMSNNYLTKEYPSFIWNLSIYPF